MHPVPARVRPDLSSAAMSRADPPIELAESLGLIDRIGVMPIATHRWTLDRSAVTFVHVTDRLHLVASCGPGHSGSVEFYAAHAPTTCAVPGSVIFWDLSKLMTTDLSVVRTCLGIAKANHKNLAQVHMFYRSPMIGMAVTVANLALNGLIQLYGEAEPFHLALRGALRGAPRRSSPST
jgi:hypothetical protein